MLSAGIAIERKTKIVIEKIIKPTFKKSNLIYFSYRVYSFALDNKNDNTALLIISLK